MGLENVAANPCLEEHVFLDPEMRMRACCVACRWCAKPHESGDFCVVGDLSATTSRSRWRPLCRVVIVSATLIRTKARVEHVVGDTGKLAMQEASRDDANLLRVSHYTYTQVWPVRGART